MVRLFGPLLLCVALLVSPQLALAQNTVLKIFSAGIGPDSIGLTASEGSEDKEEDGPQAIASGDGDTLFVLDQVNGRILAFDSRSPALPPQILNLPPGVQPTDLVVKGNSIYVWDGSIHALQALGPADGPTRSLTETRSDGTVDDFTSTAFAQMGSAASDIDDPQDRSTRGTPGAKVSRLARQSVETRGRGPVVVDVVLTDNGSGAQLDVRSKDHGPIAPKLKLRVPAKLGTVAFLGIDKDERMFVLAENIPEDIHDAAFAFVARYSAKGVLDGIYELPLDQTTSVSRRSVTISPEGDVYFLKATRKAAEVIGIGFRAMINAKVIDLNRSHPNYASLAWTNSQWVGMAVGPLTRQRIVQTAYGYEGLRWKLAPSNYGPSEDKTCSGFNGRIRRPMYLIGKEGQDVHSVPYCWGCQGSLGQFAARVQNGALAGNVCTKDGVRPDVVGVDCSSFVSAAWGLSSHFATSVIPAIASQLSNPWDLQPGDALDKPGSHVVLFLGFTAERQALVMEASPGACQGKVCRNVYPLSSLLARGFLPVRYRGVVEESQARPAKTGSVVQ